MRIATSLYLISHNTEMIKHIREIGVSYADTLMDRVKLNQDSPLKKHMQDQNKNYKYLPIWSLKCILYEMKF